MEGHETSRRSWRAALAVYRDRRIAAIFAMGFSSGLPLALSSGTLFYWLRKLELDLTTIGLFASVGLPYSLKFLWAPLFDHARIPGLARLLGRRRSWALATQCGLAVSILALGASDPTAHLFGTALAALAVAFFSASQDVVIDAYRIDVLRPEEQGAGAAATQLGYRIGMLASGAGALALADFLPWTTVFLVMASLLPVGMAAVLLAPEPPAPAEPAPSPGAAPGLAATLRSAVVEPIADFVGRRGWVAILLLALLYKFGDALGGTMANPFYQDLGFSGVEIGSVTKIWGVIASMLGITAGGALVARIGTFRALLVGGVLQAATNLLYSALALLGHSLPMLALTVGADNFTGGLGSAAFVAYLSALCHARFTATQYALLTSLMAGGRTVLSSGSGWLAERLGWAPFYAATAGLALPGLLLLVWLMRLDRGGPEGGGVSLSPAGEAS
jgi:MFS transporter, PAT family, beta-lactamase induction signal transducer AmpG